MKAYTKPAYLVARLQEIDAKVNYNIRIEAETDRIGAFNGKDKQSLFVAKNKVVAFDNKYATGLFHSGDPSQIDIWPFVVQGLLVAKLGFWVSLIHCQYFLFAPAIVPQLLSG